MVTEDTTIGALEARLREAGVLDVCASRNGDGWRVELSTYAPDGHVMASGSSIATAIDRALCRLRGGT